MSVRMTWRLSTMMALIYAVQGSFWPLLAVHLSDLGIHSRDRGWIFATLAIASATVPLGAGHLVDRLMATQRVLAATYGVGTLFLIYLASGRVTSAPAIFGVFLFYWLLTAPAYSLANSLAMRNLDDASRDFGRVRSFGTTGWMVSGWVVTLVMAASGSTQAGNGAFEALWVAAAFSAATSVYCLTLPHTPPLAVGARAIRLREAGGEILRRPGVVCVLILGLGVYMTIPVNFQIIPGYMESAGLPRAWVTAAMSLGQTSEIALLVGLPWILRRAGAKTTLAIGITAWLVRYLSLAFHPPLWVIVAGALLQGVGIACFTVGAQVYLDSKAPGHLRATAQAMMLVATSGLGALLGSLLIGELATRSHSRDVLVFLFPCTILGALLLYLLRGFRESASDVPWAGAPQDEPPSRPPVARGPAAHLGHLVTESADG